MENNIKKVKLSYDYLFIVHRIYMSGRRKLGGVDIIIDYLTKQNKNLCILEFQLGGKYIKDTEFEKFNTYSVLRNSIDAKESIIKEFNVHPKLEPFRWIGEIFYTISVIFGYVRGPIELCIASDPLNVFAAWMLRLLGKVKKIYFHSVDYSDKRFKNSFLNYIYHLSYRFAIKKANIVGVVSSNMFKKCRELGVKEDKLIFMPNAPDFDITPHFDISKREPYSLVISAASVVYKYRFDQAIDVLAKLIKEFPSAKLKIIGDTNINKDYFEEIKNKIINYHLNGNIRFLGYLTKKDNLLEIATSTIGLALYSDDTHYYMRYADPLKIREYAACGIPVITDETTSTGYDAQESKSGFVCKNEEEMVEAISDLWSKEALYKEYSDNVRKWAEQYDKNKILLNFRRTV